MNRQLKRTLMNFGLALFILWVLLTFVGWGEILATIRSADPYFVGLGAVIGTSQILVWGLNWRIVLDIIGHDMSWFKHFKIYYAGTFANSVTPLGQAGGEPVIAYIISSNSDVPYEKSMAGIMSVDILNTVPFFTFSIIGLVYFLLFHPANMFVTFVALFILVVAVVIFVFFMLFWFRKEMMIGLIVRFGELFYRFRKLINRDGGRIGELLEEGELIDKIENFYGTVRSVFSSKRSIAEVLIVSHAGWFLAMLGLYTFLLAFGWKVPFFLIMFILPASGVAFYLPLPGGLGGIEAVIVSLLIVVAGVAPSAASAAVLLHRTMTYAIPLVVGGLCIMDLSTTVFGEGGVVSGVEDR